MKSKFAGIQYLGDSGVTQISKEAIIQLIHAGEDIKDVKILTFEETYSHAHALLLTLRYDIQVIIKGGFASGYNGEAPKGYAFVLNLLRNYTDSINEYIISKSIFERISNSSLTLKDLEYINSINPVRPARWYESVYLYKEHERSIFSEFPLIIPMALLDPRLIELALDFDKNPDNVIISAYRKLESIVRDRTGLNNESGVKLFAKAFQGDDSVLYWENLDSGESKGRASLFTSVYMAYRNNRAHQEPRRNISDDIREFMLVNQLFVLDREAVARQ
ncbi:TIGR02391 family protein [Psychrobacter alimentarius]|uniref:TIGR02391 family protein n=1 Tax=Psychrobacter alimentarius TaxID=261164 RepID=UPI001919A75A|nr:TIGR02391 family protein [Psychrobacter alimentarius]